MMIVVVGQQIFRIAATATAKKAVKKIVSSPVGKTALAAAGIFKLGGGSFTDLLARRDSGFDLDNNVASPSGNAKWFTPPTDKIDNFKALSPVNKPSGSIVAYNPSLNNNINVEYKPFGPPHMTTAERDAKNYTQSQAGDIIYNTTTNKFQGLVSDGTTPTPSVVSMNSGYSWLDFHWDDDGSATNRNDMSQTF